VEKALDAHPLVQEIDDLKTIWEIHRWTVNFLEDHLRRIDA